MWYTGRIIEYVYYIRAIQLENIKSTRQSKQPQQNLASGCLKYVTACFTAYFLFFLEFQKINLDCPNQQRYKKDSLYRKRKKESSGNEKKAMKRFGETKERKGRDESNTWDRNKAEGVVQKWLVFFEKNWTRSQI